MRKTRLILGTHNHLPLGLEPVQAERLYQKTVKPFLSVLYRYPGFCATVHYSGLLLEWLEEEHPEFLTLLAEMVRRGQVEILGGGYYDPILPMIPTNDKLGQLEKLTTWLRSRFEIRPRGCWIAEKVWEPSLASVLRVSGLDYSFLDDGQFILAGLSPSGLWQPYIAEDQGKIITVLPVSSSLCALTSQAGPSAVIAYLKGLSAAEPGPSATAVLMVNGARSASGILREGWLEELVRFAEENSAWLEPSTPGQTLRDQPATRRAYVPSSSSLEMMQLSLPPDRRDAYREAQRRCGDPMECGQFVIGGHFRQFLNRSPQSWLMYSKMMNTHVLVSQVRGDRYKKKAAQNELWKGQCHHAYWHGGATGGIYENALRKAVYRSLIEAEKITRATEIFAPSIISADYDMDNMVEYLYQGSELNAYIHARGAALVELDFLPSSWNYLDTMEERGGSPTPGHRRRAFLDHFFEDDCTIDGFAAGRLKETGDFLAEPYELADLNRALPELLMRRCGSVLRDGVPCPVTIEKRFVFRPRSIDVYYRVTQPGPSVLQVPFGVELNVSLAERSPDYGRLFLLDEGRKREIESDAVEISGVQGLLVRDVRNEVSITLSSALPFRCWSLPVQTSPFSAGSGQPSFQSHCFVPLWQLELSPGEGWENHMSVGFEKTQEGRI